MLCCSCRNFSFSALFCLLRAFLSFSACENAFAVALIIVSTSVPASSAKIQSGTHFLRSASVAIRAFVERALRILFPKVETYRLYPQRRVGPQERPVDQARTQISQLSLSRVPLHCYCLQRSNHFFALTELSSTKRRCVVSDLCNAFFSSIIVA